MIHAPSVIYTKRPVATHRSYSLVKKVTKHFVKTELFSIIKFLIKFICDDVIDALKSPIELNSCTRLLN